MLSITVTDCSDAQIIPLSKVLEWDNGIYRHLHIRRIINDDWCVSCPTPSAGLPDECRFYHTASACRQGDIRLPHYHIGKLRDGTSIQPMIPSGAPAFTAASRTTFAAAIVQAFAAG